MRCLGKRLALCALGALLQRTSYGGTAIDRSQHFKAFILRSFAKLLKWFMSPNPIEFSEERAWKTGRILHRTVEAAGIAFPTIFGDTGDTYRRPAAVGVIRKIEIDGACTTCTIGLLRPLEPKYYKSVLVLAHGKRKGESLSEDDQRVYRIVDTPAFVREALGAPRTEAEEGAGAGCRHPCARLPVTQFDAPVFCEAGHRLLDESSSAACFGNI